MLERSLPTVAILMARAGGGHLTAAQSLAEALEGKAEVALISLIDDYAPFPLNRISASYGPWVTHSPWTYGKVYRLLSSPRHVEMVQRAACPLVRGRVAEALVAVAPDLVISVHPAQVAIPLRVLRETGGGSPFVTVVTDPVTPPVAWFARETDLCVVATEDARQVALRSGLPPSRVRVIGLPVRRAFRGVRDRPKAAVREQLGLDPALPAVLIAGGGAGIGRMQSLTRAIAERLATARVPAQIVVATGQNRRLLARLSTERWPLPVRSLGYVENMAHWMAASDLLVTKAGPGTLAEAACVGLPAIVTEFVPGQEEGNIAWVLESRAAVFVPDLDSIADTVEHLMQPGNPRLAHMALQARRAAHYDAADRIATAALDLCWSRGSVTPVRAGAALTEPG